MRACRRSCPSFQYADVGQITIGLDAVEPITHHASVLDGEAEIVDRHWCAGAGRLVKERADLDAARQSRAQQLQQVRDREPRIDDVLDQKHVFALDGVFEVVRDLHDPARRRTLPITADAEKLDAKRQANRARQIGGEYEASLENAYHHEGT